MRQTISYTITWFLVILSGLVVLSCSNNSSPPTVNGVAMLGPVASGATITVYGLTDTGTADPNNTITATIGADSAYSATLPSSPSSGAVMVVLNPPFTYTEESTGQQITVTAASHAVGAVAPVSGPTTDASITPVTHIALKVFLTAVSTGLSAAGKTPSQAATDANLQVGQALGVADPLQPPSNPFGTLANDVPGQYALVLVTLSKAAAAAGVNVNSVVLAQAYATNFSTNGNLNPVSITLPGANGDNVSFTPPSAATLSTTAAQIASGAISVAGVTPPPGMSPPTFNDVGSVPTPTPSPPPPPPACVTLGLPCTPSFGQCCLGLSCQNPSLLDLFNWVCSP